MKRDERWSHAETREGNPWLDHDQNQPDHLPQEIPFPNYILERLEFSLRLVRRCRAKMSNILDHSTRAEAWFYSVSTMLISFAIFWMSCISVILGGLHLTLTFLITSTVNSGRRMRKFASNIRARLRDARADQGTASAKLRTTSTSAATPDSNV